MINFNWIDRGVLGKPIPVDSTLKNMKKEQLIDMLHKAQSNYETLRVIYHQSAIDDNKCNRCPLMREAEKMIKSRRKS